jgi:hypothetical protein
MTPATLPQSLEIEGVVHVQHWRSRDLIILQNYTDQRETSDQPLQDREPQIVGTSRFHLYEVIHLNPGEQLGEKLGIFSNLTAAIAMASRTT